MTFLANTWTTTKTSPNRDTICNRWVEASAPENSQRLRESLCPIRSGVPSNALSLAQSTFHDVFMTHYLQRLASQTQGFESL